MKFIDIETGEEEEINEDDYFWECNDCMHNCKAIEGVLEAMRQPKNLKLRALRICPRFKEKTRDEKSERIPVPHPWAYHW